MKPTQSLLPIFFLLSLTTIGFSQINKDQSNYGDVLFPYTEPTDIIEDSTTTYVTPYNLKVLFENNQIRVCEITLKPSESKNVQLQAWSSILYIQTHRDFTDPSGNIVFDSRSLTKPLTYPGNSHKEPETVHQIINVSKTKTIRLIRLELKN